ncbi:FKBP-type peptidyl-prolyl cis-trans isomerase [Cellulomonas aerilata]|uniref:Peptidyl-prolyl cis-trans isomerase n=1 Tax=Cellulomonas aerilata TaxID=515326 RepID=A0A512D7C0_9CELL|nr:FKBP-type peptidyl-prolyl cis-trans isomerase [Cellulomonas aerilata]GEO32371.1 peptidylprolyl isomerase [Cellulomonas aerilata]
MRRLATVTASAAVASLLLLAGCAGSDGDSGAASTPSPSASDAAASAEAEPTAEDVAALEAVTVEGEQGAEPTLTFDQPFSVSAAVARVVTPGTGATLEDGQMLSMNVLQVNGADGSTLGTTYGATPTSLTLGDPQVFGALTDALTGQSVGARLLFAAPGAEASTLMAIDIVDAKSVPTRAEGTAVTPPEGLPKVTLAENGAPSIEPVAGDAPTELVVQPLITGTGPAVQSGQNVTFHYSGWLWDGTPFDSSWDKGSAFTTALGTGAVIAGWDQGLVGQPVGSQVLLVIPPALGYGEAEQGSIPANSTLVFVVDILAAS